MPQRLRQISRLHKTSSPRLVLLVSHLLRFSQQRSWRMADLRALLVEDEGPELSDAEVDDAPARSDEGVRLGNGDAAAAAEEPEEGELPDAQAAPHAAGGDERRGSRPAPPAAGDCGAFHSRGMKRPRDAVRERLDVTFSAEVKAAAARIAEQLKEKKVHLIRRLCDRFGIALAGEVLQETLAKESAGGMLTADGSRRREAGGTYLTLFAARVPKPALKETLAAAARDLRDMQQAQDGGARRAGEAGRGGGGGGGGNKRGRHPPPVPGAGAAADGAGIV